MVKEEGLYGILSPVRLPVSPSGLAVHLADGIDFISFGMVNG
jgi:hypothetical protein